jgi:hypothetical protein
MTDMRQCHCTVEQLREAISTLLPTDRLVTNQVSNLAVLREGVYIGYVDLANVEINIEPQAKLEMLEKDEIGVY